MRRIATLACLLATATLLPVQAEAAKFRFGRRGSASSMTHRVVVVPGIAAGTSRAPAATGQPERVPFPLATARHEEPNPLRLSAAGEASKPWCGSETVVGGFCVMN